MPQLLDTRYYPNQNTLFKISIPSIRGEELLLRF